MSRDDGILGVSDHRGYFLRSLSFWRRIAAIGTCLSG
jgi:hypothetical protein